jgi:SSS family solute:Na+ symporter
MQFSFPDLIVFVGYCLIIIITGVAITRKSKSSGDSGSFFFASNSLPWFVIGSSVIAANISAEQFVGMSGSGYAMGLAIASYEWLAAIMIIMVAIWFLPVFIRKGIYTMPQFLEVRYDKRIKTILALFWLFLFVFVNLTSILYLGALSLKTVFGIKLGYAIAGLAVFSLFLSAGGGLKTIASTDIIQVIFLVLGGLTTTWLAFEAVSGGEGILKGFSIMLEKAPEKFHMILAKSDPNYRYMPGIRSILGGIWVAGIYYFGANQYIIQKALGAKNLKEARRGLAFAAWLKLIIPLLVVLPGIAAFVLGAEINKPDEAYPWLLNRFVPSGLKGFVFAALIAAIVSSLAAIINSATTIFSIDIFRAFVSRDVSENTLVKTGRLSAIVMILLASVLASLLTNINQVFQFIQEYTGLVSPGITALFILGIFWKRTSARAAWTGVILTLPVPLLLKWLYPELPFLDNMAVSFLAISAVMVAVTLFFNGKKETGNKWFLPSDIFHIDDKVFIVAAAGIPAVLFILYFIFW